MNSDRRRKSKIHDPDEKKSLQFGLVRIQNRIYGHGCVVERRDYRPKWSNLF